MTTYYVRKSGNDSNDGLSPANAWLTIDKAADEVAAGDTVYIGAGVYRELVTMDTAGESGSPITYVGDIDGSQTGDAGIVLVSAFGNDDEAAVRAGCWDMGGREFVVVQNLQFIGTSSTFVLGNTSSASHIAYEGCRFENCAITLAGRAATTNAVLIEVNNGATPTGDGLQFSNCLFWGQFKLDWDSNDTAHVNLKWRFDNCLFFGHNTSTGNGLHMVRVTNGGSNTIGGVRVENCTFVGCNAAWNFSVIANTDSPCRMNNCVVIGAINIIAGTTVSVGSVIARGNVGMGITSGYSANIITYPPQVADGAVLLGGFHDWIWRKVFGWSPWQPFEPMAPPGYTNPLTDRAQITHLVNTTDIYNNPRQMGRSDRMAHLYYMDASDDAVSDPNSVWTNEDRIVNTDPTSSGTTNTNGSTASNFAFAGGTNAPGSGGTIRNVYARIRGIISGSSQSAACVIYSDDLAETLGTITITNTTASWSDWLLLTVPSGGWTWAKIQALEFKAYKIGGTTYTLSQIQIGVDAAETAPDVGAVEARTRPAQEATTINGGTYAARFDGAGYYDALRPVDASETTISVYARFDSNYSGDLPVLEVLNIPGVADQSDAMSGSADEWEQLSVTFTPSAAGWVRVRLRSRDNSTNGKCFFDDLAVG